METKNQQWFPANDPATADQNTGRHTRDINLQFPGPYVLNLYCLDQANGKSHADGKVYNEYFAKFYTLQDLESAGLWTRLDQRIVNFTCGVY